MQTYLSLSVDFTQTAGSIKPVNAVNNGPIPPTVRGTGNFEDYKALEIPFARNHDAAFFAGYDWEYTVDVHRIFPDFDADENNPAAYRFLSTDRYIQAALDAGTEPFYRLGCNIEHGAKYGTRPPKDFGKWARICEHIIRHYNEGWADGFHHNIRYWEIWNEPCCGNADGSNPCWQGTDEQLIDFFETAARHLKAALPALKIGGPAFCSLWGERQQRMLAELGRRRVPLDFVSYHWYGCKPTDIVETFRMARELIDRAGYPDAEAILNEWNYIEGWSGEDWRRSLRIEKGQKGAAFTAACMTLAQREPVDMFMYYDARPCGMNGIFDTDTDEPLRGYYTFLMFRDVRRLGGYVPTAPDHEHGIYSCASSDGERAALMLTHFEQEDDAPERSVRVDCRGSWSGRRVRVEYRLFDDFNNLTLMRSEVFTATEFSLYVDLPLYASWLITLTPEE